MRARMVVTALVMAAAPGPLLALTVTVDCSRGPGINQVLRLVPAPVLVIEVHGTCVENVLVTRGNVTLRGGDPASDGVRATSDGPGNVAVTVRGARDVAIERLALSGGSVGLRADTEAVVRVTGARLTANAAWGAEVAAGGALTLQDTLVERNRVGGLWVAGSASAVRATVRDNLDPDGLLTTAAYVAGSLSLDESTVSGPIGISVDTNAVATATRSDITAGARAVEVGSGGLAALNGGTLAGPFRVDGGTLRLLGVTQDDGAAANAATNNAHVVLERWGALAPVAPRPLQLDRFSNAVAEGATLGTLACSSGADAWCDGGTTAGTSTCGLCPGR